MKSILGVYSAPDQHWVGDGFPVRSLFSYNSHGEQISPFLLLDYAGPRTFEPTDHRRGVGEHPHRGFETVTMVFDGEVAHRDSTGAGGVIGPGDVQWMTAASGVLHDEFHSRDFARTGGNFEMVQLWVNLPAKCKMSPPRYQNIRRSEIPVVELDDNAGTLRVIAGNYQGHHGPAATATALDVWDLNLHNGHAAQFGFTQGHTLAVVVLQGNVVVNGEAVQQAQFVLLDRQGRDLQIEAMSESHLLILSGAPIDEPVVGYGPFVMNSEPEIRQAIQDFDQGRFGRMVG